MIKDIIIHDRTAPGPNTPDHPPGLVPVPTTPARATTLPSIVRRGETYLWGVRRDLGLAVLGKEIIQRLGEQILNSCVMLGREKTQLPFDLRWKVASDVAFPFPSRPRMKSAGFGRRGKIGRRLLRTRVARRSRCPRAAKHGLP